MIHTTCALMRMFDALPLHKKAQMLAEVKMALCLARGTKADWRNATGGGLAARAGRG